MRVFHFIGAEHGLENLRKRRLKISKLMDLNDPFEFFGVNLGDRALRRAFQVMKAEMDSERGLLCFSRSWHNPLLWSHYAERHRGLCLGFEVPDECLGPVTYLRDRLDIEADIFRDVRSIAPDMATRMLFTKYEHWKYEDEVRSFVTIEDQDPETGLYFADFSDKLKLTTVIVGHSSTLSRQSIDDVLGDLRPTVAVFKGRLAFKSFRVVRQRNDKLWE